MDDLATQIGEAHAAGDEDTVAALEAQHDQLKADSDIFAKKIEELGGFTGEFDAQAVAANKEISKLTKKITELENKITQYRDPEVRDYESARALVPKLAAAREELNAAIADLENKQRLANVKATPKDETVSMFPAEAVRPEPRNMLTLQSYDEKGQPYKSGDVEYFEKRHEKGMQGPQQPKEAPPDYSEEITKKEAEAEKLLKELDAMSVKRKDDGTIIGGSQPANPEDIKAAVEALNKARVDLRELQEESARKPEKDMDDALRSAQGNVSFSDLLS